ncbi:hypothetical protein CRUP_006907 [Coryphaenoides rupestris]|nr:hypothetical protein CRUP_006907 [Coryphaenoides rupestris]
MSSRMGDSLRLFAWLASSLRPIQWSSNVRMASGNSSVASRSADGSFPSKHQSMLSRSSEAVLSWNSAFTLEEDEQVKSSSGIKTVTEAFKVIGSVLYFTTFSVDKLGQPLLDENPQLTDGWEVPTYLQVFNQVIGTDGQEIGMKERRPKSMCFNCGSPGHQIRDCPKPKDQAAINERRKEFSQNQSPTVGNQRYHAEVEERFAKYKAGLMSEELLSALGVGVNTLPPLIYRMRQLGYPPGWLKEAEMENSGLALYDGKDGESKEETNGQRISYDVSKLVDFPGFNVAASPNMKDEYKLYGSVPMQGNHLKSNFAAYLSNSFPTSGATSNKRRHDSEPSPHQPKKPRASPAKSSDMDMDSGFQPPLPPGSPSFGSPPPLPLGTPPATPTRPPLPKGTPPPTPTNGAAALPGRAWVVVDEAGEGAEDGLTLEELEEQQRLIWAALENADTATSSDCETQATGTSVPSSPGVSTPARVDTETEMDTEDLVNLKSSADDVKEGSESPGPNKSERETPQSPGPIRAQEENPLSPVPIGAQEENPLSPVPVGAQEESPLSPGPIRAPEESPLSPGPIRAQEVPHRSHFAAGIVPFEDTPEFTEVAASTGTYQRIRGLLKSSPRNVSRSNK